MSANTLIFKRIFPGIFLGVVVLCSIVVLVVAKNRSVENPQDLANLLTSSPAPTSPFAEMTIPFLRQKTYASKLGEKQKISENSSYTSYLTSYTSDNLKINALLTEPKGEKPVNGWPAIVFVHGYIPPTLYKTTEKYAAYVDALARNGFVVLKIDLRGHGDSEGEPSGAYYSPDYVVDTLNAYAALENTDFVDHQHIGLWGHSMAGNVVLRSLVSKPEIPATVIWAGAGYSYEDLLKYGLNDNSYRPPEQNTQRNQRRQQLFALYGEFKLGNPFWKEVAPTNYLNDLKGAIQLHHAKDDDVVSIHYSQDLTKMLDQTQVPHELYEYPSGGHNISGGSFTQAMKRTVEFFKKYL